MPTLNKYSSHVTQPKSQGASQAMEDGVCLAVCLERAGKRGVPEALRVYETLRYDRVKAAQKTGEATRDLWHKADFDQVRANPESVRLKRESWLLGHDAELHAYENYDTAVQQAGVEK